VSRRREEDTKSEKRSHHVSLFLICLGGLIQNLQELITFL
jgi:hypothetical protein